MLTLVSVVVNCGCIGIPPKFIKENDMYEDTVTPHVNIDAEDEVRKALYQHFKESNWWARNKYFPLLFSALCAVMFLKWVTSVDLDIIIKDNHDLVALPLMFMMGTAFLLANLAFLKYVYHDIPWRKYKEDWGVPEDYWTTNIGGVLKIYD